MSAIVDWLDRQGLSKYKAVFVDNDVDLEVLPRLSEDDLRELGLPLGARKRILQAVAELRAQRATIPAPPASGPAAAAGAGPERRQITVMFADVVGSASVAEQLDVEDLRSLLLAYQEACAAAIERYGGHIAQYLGDGVLAYFGYPQAHEDDAVRAVRAALTIIDRMRETSVRTLSEHGVGLEIRIGVNTGLVVAGEMGAGGTREQLAVGETPNVAARIQGLADPNTVVVSEATWRLVEGFFTAQPLGSQSLKGVSRPMLAYRILAATEAANRFEARLARSLTPLVSRDVELAFLQQRWDQATDGEGQAVLLQGEAGIGKSRLVRTFRERLDRDAYQAITLSCSSDHQASAFYPVVDQLGRVLEFSPDDSHGARQAKLGAFIGRLGLPVDRLAPALCALLGIARDDTEPRPPADPAQLRRDTLDALVQIVAAFSRERPVLFVIEDAHWIDPSTQELIGHVLDGINARRVLMVMTARPEYRAPWVGLAYFSTLSLSRLSRRETEAMIRRVAGAELASEVVAQLVSRTDGVPLFIEELTKSVLDVQGESPVSTLSVPATLQEALTARLDRLAPVRDLIQVAALLGRVFDVDVVQVATGLNRTELERSLADLIGSGLIYRRPQQHGHAFEFKHALIQEAALNTLVRQRRAHLHGRIADALERIRPELAQRQPEVLAHHLREAGDDRRAWVFWRAAGDLATQSSSSREAVTHFTHATECLKRLGLGAASHDDEARIYLGLSGALMRADGYRSERLEHALDSAQRAARASGSASLQWRAALQTAPLCYSTGRNGEYLAAVEELKNHVPIEDNPWMRAGVLMTRGIAYFNRGEYMEAERHLQATIDLVCDLPGNDAVRIGDGDLSIVVRSYTMGCLARLGRLDEALHTGLAAERIGRGLDDRFSFAWALSVRGRAYNYVGDHQAALADAEELNAICREHGFTARLGNALMHRGAARAHLGELEEGIEDFREGRAIWRGSGVVFHAPEHAAELAGLLLMAGRVAEGHAVLEDVEGLVAGTDEAACLAECQRLRGMIAVADGDVATAERWLNTAIATARGQGAALFELRAMTRLTELLATQGREADAVRRLGDVYASFTQGHGAPDLQEAKAVLDRLRT
jgi:class 3 adenylate cyclase/tetratricopeptide (TPR) repeat protein